MIDWLKNSKHYHPEKIIERDGWSIKKKSDYANKVVDEMEEKGQIKELYREFQSNLDAARGAKVRVIHSHHDLFVTILLTLCNLVDVP